MMSLEYQDTFEEFLARSVSGGFLPPPFTRSQSSGVTETTPHYSDTETLSPGISPSHIGRVSPRRSPRWQLRRERERAVKHRLSMPLSLTIDPGELEFCKLKEDSVDSEDNVTLLTDLDTDCDSDKDLEHISHGFLSDTQLGTVDEDDDERHTSQRRCSLPPDSPNSPKNKELEVDEQRTHLGDYKYVRRMRSFKITPQGLVKEHVLCVSGAKATVRYNMDSSTTSRSAPGQKNEVFVVFLLGATGVGKRALVEDFMVPEHHPFVSLSLDEDKEKTVSILLDGEESTLDFVELPDQEVDQFVTADEIHAYVVVYSVEDRRSFEAAIDRLIEIRQNEQDHQSAVILVANKTDLVRTRVVLEHEGKAAAKTYDSKYIEVSAAIDHKIDELLVGIVKQIRLMKQKVEKMKKTKNGKSKQPKAASAAQTSTSSSTKDDSPCNLLKRGHEVLGKFFRGRATKSKSCDNLYVL